MYIYINYIINIEFFIIIYFTLSSSSVMGRISFVWFFFIILFKPLRIKQNCIIFKHLRFKLHLKTEKFASFFLFPLKRNPVAGKRLNGVINITKKKNMCLLKFSSFTRLYVYRVKFKKKSLLELLLLKTSQPTDVFCQNFIKIFFYCSIMIWCKYSIWCVERVYDNRFHFACRSAVR